VAYHYFDYLYVLTYVMREYNWNKLSLIAHSMGAQVAFIYTAIFPERVDIVVNIEGMKPYNYAFSTVIRELEDSLENFLAADLRNNSKSEPPSYTIDEMVERMFVGSFESVTRENIPYLLKRSIQPSKKHPGKFFFSSDGRLKHIVGFNFSLSTYIDLAREIKIPYLMVKADKTPLLEDRANFDAVLNAMKESKNFEYFVADSLSHHVHLTEPEKVSGVISEFILRKKSPKNHL
jgi:pimeloyl-ACP methyl ester carboxylesterase